MYEQLVGDLRRRGNREETRSTKESDRHLQRTRRPRFRVRKVLLLRLWGHDDTWTNDGRTRVHRDEEEEGYSVDKKVEGCRLEEGNLYKRFIEEEQEEGERHRGSGRVERMIEEATGESRVISPPR